jgi:hypothetical protein
MPLVDICIVIVSASFLVTNYSPTWAAKPCSGTHHDKILPASDTSALFYFAFITEIQDKVKEHAARVENISDQWLQDVLPPF